MTNVKVSPSYHIIIPQDVRKSMKVKPGQEFTVYHDENKILLIPVLPMKKLRGFLRGMSTDFYREKTDRV